MALLGLFSGSNIRENNLVQTVCSSAGAMASIIFVLPGLVIVGLAGGRFPADQSASVGSGRRTGRPLPSRRRRGLVTSFRICPIPKGSPGAEVPAGRIGKRAGAPNREAHEGLMATRLTAMWRRRHCPLLRRCSWRLDEADGFFRTFIERAPAPAAIPCPFPSRCWAPGIQWEFQSAWPWRRALPLPGRARCRMITAVTPDHGMASLSDYRHHGMAHPGAFHRRRRHVGGGNLVPDPHHRTNHGRAERSIRRTQTDTGRRRPDRPRHFFQLDGGLDGGGRGAVRRSRSGGFAHEDAGLGRARRSAWQGCRYPSCWCSALLWRPSAAIWPG